MPTTSSRRPLSSSVVPSRATWWKILGAAGLAGLVATGALTVRQERRRAAYTPEEIRERLHRRHAEAEADLARREVLLDATTAPPRTLSARLDLVARRYRRHLPPTVRRLMLRADPDPGRPAGADPAARP